MRRPVDAAPCAVALSGGGVYLDGDAAALVLFLLRYHAASAGPRDGVATAATGSPLVREIRAACEASARSGAGQVHRTSGAPATESTPERPDDLLTAAQVAQELHMTDRHVRRLACAGELGDVVYAGRVIQLRRFEVDAYRNRTRSL